MAFRGEANEFLDKFMLRCHRVLIGEMGGENLPIRKPGATFWTANASWSQKIRR